LKGVAVIRFMGSVAVSLWLCGKHVGPDVEGTPTEGEGNALLALLQFLNEFDAGEDNPRVLEF
jgi:hypothetical protein